ncbi:MAG: hypothetical protein HY039_10495 [Nitrospirae bacterium]|nr:hypothetical protein [Nitrospirota bacterium]
MEIKEKSNALKLPHEFPSPQAYLEYVERGRKRWGEDISRAVYNNLALEGIFVDKKVHDAIADLMLNEPEFVDWLNRVSEKNDRSEGIRTLADFHERARKKADPDPDPEAYYNETRRTPEDIARRREELRKGL